MTGSGQTGAATSDPSLQVITTLPGNLLSRIQAKTSGLERQLTGQTDKYLRRMARREDRLRRKLDGIDSNASKQLFLGVSEKYTALAARLKRDTGSALQSPGGEYKPYIDSLNGLIHFLQQKNDLSATQHSQLQQAASSLQGLQAKLSDADQVKEFLRQRRQQIQDYLSQHTGLPASLAVQYKGINQDIYYYSQQVRGYKEMLNDPDKLEKQALNILGRLPAFQAFMKQNSQLAGLFNLPGNYSDPSSLTGLQTRDQVSSLINGQIASGGAGAQAALQGNLQSAQSQMTGYKDKLEKLGAGSGDIDMPDFKPNGQKTKTFWNRLEYGANFQTTRNNYYFPTVSDLGLSIGFKVSDKTLIGLGASFKIGWGNGIQHIALSSEGLGLRSFADIKIKTSFYASGGFEYNYTKPFRSLQELHRLDDWTRSGLIGISKIVSMKSRAFKKTKLQLLWDFLSYQQIPKTQPIIFRIGYSF